MPSVIKPFSFGHGKSAEFTLVIPFTTTSHNQKQSKGTEDSLTQVSETALSTGEIPVALDLGSPCSPHPRQVVWATRQFLLVKTIKFIRSRRFPDPALPALQKEERDILWHSSPKALQKWEGEGDGLSRGVITMFVLESMCKVNITSRSLSVDPDDLEIATQAITSNAIMAEMMRKTLPQWRQRCSGFLYKKDSQDVLDGDWTPLDFLKAERELLKVSPFGKEAADAFEILVAILSKKDHLAEHGHPQYPLPKHCPWTAGWIYYCMGPIIHFAVQHLQEYGVEYFASLYSNFQRRQRRV